ncbi:MAG: hypothetical protein ACOH19_08320 [Rhodoglobus sp.]
MTSREPSKRAGAFIGAATGVLGVPLGYVLLQSLGIIITDALLWMCVVAPSVLWLLAAVIGRFRPWIVRAVVGAAIATLALVAGILGGLSLWAWVLSDPVA